MKNEKSIPITDDPTSPPTLSYTGSTQQLYDFALLNCNIIVDTKRSPPQTSPQDWMINVVKIFDAKVTTEMSTTFTGTGGATDELCLNFLYKWLWMKDQSGTFVPAGNPPYPGAVGSAAPNVGSPAPNVSDDPPPTLTLSYKGTTTPNFQLAMLQLNMFVTYHRPLGDFPTVCWDYDQRVETPETCTCVFTGAAKSDDGNRSDLDVIYFQLQCRDPGGTFDPPGDQPPIPLRPYGPSPSQSE